MNFPYFIAKRLSTGKRGDTSQLIVRIAVAGVALSIAVMIISLAIVKGYQSEIRNKITGFSTHIQITRLDLNNSYEMNPVMEDSILEKLLREEKGVLHLQRFALKPGIIKTHEDFKGIVLKGTDDTYDWSFIRKYMVSGELFDKNDTSMRTEIILSQIMADQLKLKTGDHVVMYFVQEPLRVRKFKIKGIYKTGFDELDELYAFTDLRHVQKLNNWNREQISGYEILTDDFSKLDETSAAIANLTPYNLQVRTIRDLHPDLFDWLSLLDLNVIVIIVLMIIIACINMVTALLILIVERSNMIGILKSMGAGNLSISKVFIYMAAYLIILGLVCGNIVGIGLCLAQKEWGLIKLSQEAYFISEVPILLSLKDLLLINVVSFLVCYIVLLVPSAFVSRISPAKAIRFE